MYWCCICCDTTDMFGNNHGKASIFISYRCCYDEILGLKVVTYVIFYVWYIYYNVKILVVNNTDIYHKAMQTKDPFHSQLPWGLVVWSKYAWHYHSRPAIFFSFWIKTTTTFKSINVFKVNSSRWFNYICTSLLFSGNCMYTNGAWRWSCLPFCYMPCTFSIIN